MQARKEIMATPHLAKMNITTYRRQNLVLIPVSTQNEVEIALANDPLAPSTWPYDHQQSPQREYRTLKPGHREQDSDNLAAAQVQELPGKALNNFAELPGQPAMRCLSELYAGEVDPEKVKIEPHELESPQVSPINAQTEFEKGTAEEPVEGLGLKGTGEEK
jgi:hypothetical protein